jgi:hypothetical protein
MPGTTRPPSNTEPSDRLTTATEPRPSTGPLFADHTNQTRRPVTTAHGTTIATASHLVDRIPKIPLTRDHCRAKKTGSKHSTRPNSRNQNIIPLRSLSRIVRAGNLRSPAQPTQPLFPIRPRRSARPHSSQRAALGPQCSATSQSRSTSYNRRSKRFHPNNCRLAVRQRTHRRTSSSRRYPSRAEIWSAVATK